MASVISRHRRKGFLCSLPPLAFCTHHFSELVKFIAVACCCPHCAGHCYIWTCSAGIMVMPATMPGGPEEVTGILR